MKPKLTTIVLAVVFVTAMASLTLLSSAANGTEIADFTPTAMPHNLRPFWVSQGAVFLRFRANLASQT